MDLKKLAYFRNIRESLVDEVKLKYYLKDKEFVRSV